VGVVPAGTIAVVAITGGYPIRIPVFNGYFVWRDHAVEPPDEISLLN
jgi:hypothetical protein